MFNIEKAVQSLNLRAQASSTHNCAKYVRLAMESGGLDTSGRPNWAWQYINWLPTQGWEEVSRVSYPQAQNEFTLRFAQPGDIAVYMKPGFGTSHPGHICMFNGTQWVSDFKQKNMAVYNGSPCDIYVFRYTGEISNSPLTKEDVAAGEGFGFSFNSSSSGNTSSSNQTKPDMANTVYSLASTKEREDVVRLDDGRKQQFEMLRTSLMKNMVNTGRDVITSTEFYSPSIMKSTQTAKQERV